jgi:hypothetical protein
MYLHGDIRIAYRIFVGKSEWRITRGRLRRRWQDNIEMDHNEAGCVSVWIEYNWLWIGSGCGLK